LLTVRPCLGRQALALQPSSLREEHELDHEISDAADGDALADLEAGTEVGKLEPPAHTKLATDEPHLTLSEKPSPAEGSDTETEHKQMRSPKRKLMEEGEWEEGGADDASDTIAGTGPPKRRFPPGQIQNISADEGALQYGTFFGHREADDYLMEGVPIDEYMV
jgi:hypothetical protein